MGASTNPKTHSWTATMDNPTFQSSSGSPTGSAKKNEKDSSRGAGQGVAKQATSNTDIASQHQPKLRRDPIARTRHKRLRQSLPGHPGRYSLPCGVADRSVGGRTDHRVSHHRVRHYRQLPNNRSPAPGAHPSRDGNLRGALTTSHQHTRHEPPRIITAGAPSRATTPSGPHTIVPTPTRQSASQASPPPAWPGVSPGQSSSRKIATVTGSDAKSRH